jgi:mRNA interferase RelE/StbE
LAFSIDITPLAREQIDALPRKVAGQVERKIISLSDNPRPAGYKPLQGKIFNGLCRIRSGDYRIIYRIEDARLVIVIVKVGNRKDIYG